MRVIVLILISLCLQIGLIPSAGAVMEIQVIGGAANKIAIALVPFPGATNSPKPSLAQIAGDDLNRSGQF